MILLLVRAALVARLTTRPKTSSKTRQEPAKPHRTAIAWGIEPALQPELRAKLLSGKFGGITNVDFHPTSDMTQLIRSGARLLVMVCKPDEHEVAQLLATHIQQRTAELTGRHVEARSFSRYIQMSSMKLLMSFVWIG